MNPHLFSLLLPWLALTLLCTPPLAQESPEFSTVSVQTAPDQGPFKAQYVTVRGRKSATQGFLYLRVAAPKAQVVLFAGGKGNLGISSAGIARDGNFLVRTRGLFAQQGFNVAVIDVPSDRKSLRKFRTRKKHVQDIVAVLSFLRRSSPAPLWLVGTSRGTVSAANNAVGRKHHPQADGLVLTSSLVWQKPNAISVFSTKLDKIRMPTLVLHHRNDGCKATLFRDVPLLMKALQRVQIKELIAVEGGEAGNGEVCKGKSHHGFLGIEARVVLRIADWIKAHPPR